MGLIGTVAKTAVISGTATATRNAVNRRQADKNVGAYAHASDHAAQEINEEHAQAEQAQQATEYEAAPSQEDTIDQLERLGKLHEQGILTDEEFAAQKKKILGI
jgi:hypothetical protein